MMRTVLICAALLLEIRSFTVSPSLASAAEASPTVICDIQKGPCAATTGNGLSIQFDITPRPVRAMSELTFHMNISRQGRPVDDAEVTLSLTMPGMYMGKNQPVVKAIGNGRYEATGIVTRCMSGRKTWQAEVMTKETTSVAGNAASYQFEAQ